MLYSIEGDNYIISNKTNDKTDEQITEILKLIKETRELSREETNVFSTHNYSKWTLAEICEKILWEHYNLKLEPASNNEVINI